MFILSASQCTCNSNESLYEFDRQEGVPLELLCGVDEAGRGPLAGDVYAAAVILPENCSIDGLNDSKKLSGKKRELLFDEISKKAISYSVGIATIAEIEKYNILGATLLAMRRAVEGLSVVPSLCLVDGNQNPRLSVHSRCIVKGDSTSACIAAASIIAKVSRDRYMKQLAEKYPQYQFHRHNGYGTKLHYQMLDEHGISDVHRLSFLKKYLSGEKSRAKISGDFGEKAASEYLIDKGYSILSQNYNTAVGELDIIVQRENIIAFVEVKTRKLGGMTTARSAVGKSKQDKLLKTAALYIAENKNNFNSKIKMRFDIIEIYIGGNGEVAQLCHIKNAFNGDGTNIFI